jgi:hypothetical protein
MVKANGRKSRVQLTATIMKVNTNLIRKMDMVFLLGKVETSIKVTTKMMKEMAMERCFGLMVQDTTVNGK